jgi:hypothetical protein
MIAFVRAVPATREILTDHIACNGELLPHLLMADLRQFLVYLLAADDRRTISDFLSEIERLASSDDAGVRDVVDMSFVEGLVLGDPRERSAIEAIRPLIGPATALSLETNQEHDS